MKLSMARASSQGAWITNNNHGNIELNVNRLTATYLASLEQDKNMLQQATNTTRGMIGQSMTFITKHPQ